VSLECEAAGAGHKRGVFSIGAVGRCLAKKLAVGAPLDPSCRELVMAAAPSVSSLLCINNFQCVKLVVSMNPEESGAREERAAAGPLLPRGRHGRSALRTFSHRCFGL